MVSEREKNRDLPVARKGGGAGGLPHPLGEGGISSGIPAAPGHACQEVCDFIFASFDGLLPYDRVAIATLDEDGATLRLAGVAARVPDQHIAPTYSGSLGHGTLGTVLAALQPRIINDLASYARGGAHSPATALLVREGYAASLTCPLRYKGRDLGFLFFNCRRNNAYQTEHSHMVRRIAVDVAAVVSDLLRRKQTGLVSASVLGAALSALARTARRAQLDEALLARLVGLVNQGITLDQVLDTLFDTFSLLLPYDRIGFALYDAETRTVSSRWARSNGPIRLGGGFTLPIEATSLGLVLEAGTPRIINDLETYLADHPESTTTRLMVEEGLGSSLTYFLGSPESPLAFLFFDSRAKGAYRTAHVARLRRLTEPLSAVFARAVLVDQLREARARAEELLHRVVPPSIARRVQAGERDVVDAHEVTVVIADLVGFSTWSSELTPLEMFQRMSALFRRIDACAAALNVYRVRTLGDGYLAASGIPEPRPDHAQAAALLAFDIMRIVRETRGPDGVPLQARVGLHSGPVVAGVMGGSDLQYEVWGPTVSIAVRMESTSEPGRIQVSAATARLLAGHFGVELRGVIDAKGVGPIETWWLREPLRM